MFRVIVVVVAGLAACGRIDFGLLGGAVDGSVGDGAVVLDDSGGVIHGALTFGENGGAMFHNVTADTYLFSTNPTLNYGTDPLPFSDQSPERNGLIRFDLSAISPAAVVDHVELFLHCETNHVTGATPVDIYQVLQSWDEGAGSGAAGVANWTQRSLGVPWATPGADPPSSRSTISLGTFSPNVLNTGYVVALDANGSIVVQGWIADPATNFGFAIVTAGNGWNYSSRESLISATRPMLFVTLQ